MKIPLVDLKAQYESIKPEIDNVIQEVLEKTSFIKGPYLEEFERNFADACGSKYCIGTSSGTTALEIVLRVLGISEDDEVIVPVNTFMATLETIIAVKASPVFVDCNETSNIDVEQIESKITPHTKAIIPVHLYGRPAEMETIIDIAEKHNLKILEDCAQAHLAEYKGKKIPFSSLGAFSFYPGKNLGAYGDAGAVVTNDENIAEKIRKLIDHGRMSKYEHDEFGYNYRMDSLQAAILNVKLAYLDTWTVKRRKLALLYTHLLKDICEIPAQEAKEKHVYHLYVIQVNKRNELQEYLREHGVFAGIHYPIPLHLQPACKIYKHRLGDFPVAERQAERILSLPLYPEMTEEMVEFVCEKIKEFYR